MKLLSILDMRKTLAAAMILALCACSMEVPSNVSLSRTEVVQKEFFADFPLDAVNEDLLQAIGSRYNSAGHGVANITVTYDPESRKNTVHAASSALKNIEDSLNKLGIKQLRGDILPVKGQGNTARLMVAFEQISLRPPPNCSQMPGLNGAADAVGMNDYKLGCQIETLFAQQVARPSDLLGNESEPGAGYSTRTFMDTSSYAFNGTHVVIQELGQEGTTN